MTSTASRTSIPSRGSIVLSRSRLRLVPSLDDTATRGFDRVLSTRCPEGPNPIRLSVVRLLGVEGSTLRVAGVDLLDGTPVLDLEPFGPEFDVLRRSEAAVSPPARKCPLEAIG